MKTKFKISFYFLICVTILVLQFTPSCKKVEKEFGKIQLFSQQELVVHNQQINAWLKMFQVNEQIKAGTRKQYRTIQSKGQIITSLQIGENGNSIYFITEKNKFAAYGINSELNKTTNNGLVEVYDFRKMEKYGLKFKNGKLEKLLTYPTFEHFNPNSPFASQSIIIQNGRTTSGIISGIRKFFCELFGSYWDATIAGNATNPGGSCSFPSNGEGQVESIQAGDGGGGGYSNYGPIYVNLNNPSFFDYSNSGFWSNYLNNPFSGGGGTSTGILQIPPMTFEQKRDFLITTLALNQTQEFFLINTDGIIDKIFELLITSGATNKIDISMYAINYISTALNLSTESIEYLKRHLIKPINDVNYLSYITAHMQTPTNGQMWWEDENWLYIDENYNGGITYLDALNIGTGGITEKIKKHVIKGEVKGGKGQGGHSLNSIKSATNPNGTLEWKSGTTQRQGPYGMKKGLINVKDSASGGFYPKTDSSSFFPASWSNQKILDEIKWAYEHNPQKRFPNNPTNNHWEGKSSDGIITIRMFLSPNTQTGDIITAFPVF